MLANMIVSVFMLPMAVQNPDWMVDGDIDGAKLGWSVASAGDVNNDGYDDVILSAWWHGPNNVGTAYVYLGAATGLSTSPVWQVSGTQNAEGVGVVVAGAGDVNGDGFDDVIVGADLWGNPEPWEGTVRLYYGSSTGPSLMPSWTFESNQAYARLCTSAGADINGDGYSDIVVGAWFEDCASSDDGQVRVFYGSSSGLSATPSLTVCGGQSRALFGGTVQSAGDVDGDGYCDILVSAPGDDVPPAIAGNVYLFRGSAAGLSATPAWSVPAGQVNGGSATTAGDVNGDGYADVLVGAAGFSSGEASEGRVTLYLGSSTGLSLNPDWSVESNQVGAQLGSCIAGLGDINGDGYGDVVVGANQFDNGQVDEGRVMVYLGSPCGLALLPTWTAESNQAGANMGIRAAGADVNGDGLADVLVGAYLYGGGTNRGRAYAFYGRAVDDCNANGVSDVVDISSASSSDCNGNLVPDECDIRCSTSSDTNGNGVPDECEPSARSFCYGDGSGAPCPCGNSGLAGHGCGNSVNANGALLTWSGSASISNDTFVLQGSGMPSNTGPSAIYLQGTDQDSFGLGTPVQDGLRCVIGNIIRLGTRPNAGGQSQFPDVGTQSISARGGITSPGTRYYQVYYRNAAATFCPPGTANWTNGVAVPWLP